jgi:hypothetical protein
MAILKSKQLNPNLTGSFVLSGSSQTLRGTTTIFGSTTVSGSVQNLKGSSADFRIRQDDDTTLVKLETDSAGSSAMLLYDNKYHSGGNTVDINSADSTALVIKSGSSTVFTVDRDNTLISGSSTSTGSFGTIQTTTGTIPTLIGNTTFRDNLTVAGNLDVSDTIYHTGDSNTKIRFPEVDTIAFNTSGTERLRIDASGHITASGELAIGNNEKLYLNKTEDTYIQSMAGDIARVVAGGNQMLLLDYDTGNRAVFGNGTKVYIGADNTKLPDKELVVDGDISGSATSTGSFGTLETSGVINATGRIFENGTSVIDHATAMAIVFGG